MDSLKTSLAKLLFSRYPHFFPVIHKIFLRPARLSMVYEHRCSSGDGNKKKRTDQVLCVDTGGTTCLFDRFRGSTGWFSPITSQQFGSILTFHTGLYTDNTGYEQRYVGKKPGPARYYRLMPGGGLSQRSAGLPFHEGFFSFEKHPDKTLKTRWNARKMRHLRGFPQFVHNENSPIFAIPF